MTGSGVLKGGHVNTRQPLSKPKQERTDAELCVHVYRHINKPVEIMRATLDLSRIACYCTSKEVH